MRLVNGDVNVYYFHDTLTPGNVRAASYGTASTSGALVPEVGDILHNFPGWTGSAYEAITVRVIAVKSVGEGVEAYEVRTTTVVPGPDGETDGHLFGADAHMSHGVHQSFPDCTWPAMPCAGHTPAGTRS
jgi:hypothetical protein